jgi:hypothetical protein
LEERFATKQGNALDSPAVVRNYPRLLLAPIEHEVFFRLFLDSQNRIIATEELFRGTLTQTSVYPREVVKTALRHNCASVIVAHKHRVECFLRLARTNFRQPHSKLLLRWWMWGAGSFHRRRRGDFELFKAGLAVDAMTMRRDDISL